MLENMEGRLNEEEARNEADMMNANLEAKRHGNANFSHFKEINGLYEKPTAAEYQQAFEIIEQLKQAAADEPEYQKVLAKILRVTARPVQELLHSLDVLGTGESIRAEVKDWHEKRLRTFEDAEKRLSDMQKQGEEYADRKNS